MAKETTTEYQIQGGRDGLIDEIFPTQKEAEDYLHAIGDQAQMTVQFFSKEWVWNEHRSVWEESNVEIIKDYGEVL